MRLLWAPRRCIQDLGEYVSRYGSHYGPSCVLKTSPQATQFSRLRRGLRNASGPADELVPARSAELRRRPRRRVDVGPEQGRLQAAQGPGGWSDAADLSASGGEYKLAQFALSQLQTMATAATAKCSVLQGARMSAPLTSAQTQVVSGTKHQIVAPTSVGALSLAIYEQAWTETLTVNEAKLDADVIVAEPVDLDYDAYALGPDYNPYWALPRGLPGPTAARRRDGH